MPLYALIVVFLFNHCIESPKIRREASRLYPDRFHLMFHLFNHKNQKNQSSDKKYFQFLGDYFVSYTSFFLIEQFIGGSKNLHSKNFLIFYFQERPFFFHFDHFWGLFWTNLFRFPESKEIWSHKIRFFIYLGWDLS